MRLATLLVAVLPRAAAAAMSFSASQVQQVVARLAEGATHSWELGTRAQAVLELNAPFFSVFSNTPLPLPHNTPTPATDLTDVVGIARYTVSQPQNASAPQPRPLLAGDGAAGDPASLGVPVLLANWTDGSGDYDYAAAATAQLEHLLTSVPRTDDGAISHRETQVQLWSDFVYMVPPFFVYYGVVTQNRSVLAESYNQIRLYRAYLRDGDADSLWRHIALGNGTDSGHWSTGNGWAAAGILRVLATIMHSNFASQFKSEQNDLKHWALEIISGMYRHRTPDGLFNNYADDPSTFQDASSAALIAAATYRLALLTKTYSHIPDAERTRQTLANGTHLDADGWLTPVVNPENMAVQGAHSPEAQAFVVEMHAAWRDWVAAGSPGTNAARRTTTPAAAAAAAGLLACGVLLLVVPAV